MNYWNQSIVEAFSASRNVDMINKAKYAMSIHSARYPAFPWIDSTNNSMWQSQNSASNARTALAQNLEVKFYPTNQVMLKRQRAQPKNVVNVSEPNAPRTTPECKRLESMVIAGLKSSVFDTDKKEATRVALKRLRKNRCVKSLEYIIQVTSNRNVFDAFAKEVFDTATKYLSELS